MEKKIIFCNCKGNVLKNDSKEEIRASLRQKKISFTTVDDLCGVCVSQREELKEVISSSDEIMIIACRPRAVKLLLTSSGIASEQGKIHYFNFPDQHLVSLMDEIDAFKDTDNNFEDSGEIKAISEWPAWYPVIDYSRCSSCGQCADFCLFAVFEKKEGKVQVTNPHGCKNNCPACARICPETAIIFPKYEHGGAIAGDEAIDEMKELQRQQKDIDEILGSEIYQALEKRKLKRQSIIRSNAMQEAIKEREKALYQNREK